MKILEVVNIHTYRPKSKHWKTPAPRPYDFLAWQKDCSSIHEVRGKKLDVPAHSLLFLRAEDPYEVFIREPGLALVAAIRTEGIPESFCVPFPEETGIEHLFRRMESAADLEKESNRLLVTGLVYEVFALAQKKAEQPATPPTIGKMEEVRAFIAAHATENDWDSAKLAEISGFSTRYVEMQFRNLWGITPRQYALRLRLDRVCMYLEQGGMALDEIAEQTGFSDASYLGKTFRARFGVSPGAYRRRMLERTGFLYVCQTQITARPAFPELP